MTKSARSSDQSKKLNADKNLRLIAEKDVEKKLPSVFKPCPARTIYTEKTPNGKTIYRLWIGQDKNGKAIKPRFGSRRRDAELFQEAWNRAVRNNDISALTILDDVAEVDVRWAMAQLRKVNATIREAVTFYVEHAFPESGYLKVPDAIDKYYEIQKLKNLKDASASKEHKNYRTYALPLRKFFADKELIRLTEEDVKKYIKARGKNWSERVNNDHLNFGRRVWNILADAKYCSAALNPFEYSGGRKRVAKKRGTKKVMSPNLIRQFFRFAENECRHDSSKYQDLCFLTLTFFCFVRTEEAEKAEWSQLKKNQRLNDEAPDRSSWTITIWADEEKTDKDKINPIPDCAKYWLSLCEQHRDKTSDKMVAANCHDRAKNLRRRFKDHYKETFGEEINVPQNTGRHSACVYHLGLYDNYPLTVKRLNHGTVSTMRNNYEAVVDFTKSKKFYNIYPEAETQRRSKLRKQKFDSYWKSKGFENLRGVHYFMSVSNEGKRIFTDLMLKAGVSEIEIEDSLRKKNPIEVNGKLFIHDSERDMEFFVKNIQNSIPNNPVKNSKGTLVASMVSGKMVPHVSQINEQHLRHYDENFFRFDPAE